MTFIIDEPWHCDVTGKPLGTDTTVGAPPCECQGCRAAEEIGRLRAELAEWRALGEKLPRLRDAYEPEAEIARLRKCLNSRDDFLGSIGQWEAYVATLPPVIRKGEEDSLSARCGCLRHCH